MVGPSVSIEGAIEMSTEVMECKVVEKGNQEQETPKRIKKEGNPCLCGCGGITKNYKSHYLPGHDARLCSILKKVEKGELGEDALPAIIQDKLMVCSCCGQKTLQHESGMGPLCRSGKYNEPKTRKAGK